MKKDPFLKIFDSGNTENCNVDYVHQFGQEEIQLAIEESAAVYEEEGVYEVAITAEDEVGNIATETISFTVDMTPPVVEIIAPTEGFYTSQNLPSPAIACMAE